MEAHSEWREKLGYAPSRTIPPRSPIPPEHLQTIIRDVERDIQEAYWTLYCEMLDAEVYAGALPWRHRDSHGNRLAAKASGPGISTVYRVGIARCGGTVGGAVRRGRQRIALHHLELARAAGLDLTATSASEITKAATGHGLSRKARARFSTPARDAQDKTQVLPVLHGALSAAEQVLSVDPELWGEIQALLGAIKEDRLLLDRECSLIRGAGTPALGETVG